jgi:hypothetical protein
VNGGTYFYLDVHGQMRPVGKHDAQAIMALFGHMLPKLYHNFPAVSLDRKTGDLKIKPEHFNHQLAASAMFQACSERGLFDPEGSVRGVGAWTDDDGNLIYHTGDTLIMKGETQKPTTHQNKIYPAYPPIPHPALPGKHADPVPDLLELLNTWQWQRPEIDATIALGMMGVQAFGGALDWRPAYWLTGGPGTGKSALQRLMNMLHGGDKGLIQSPDATARGIASLMGQSTLPIALDELEPGDTGSAKERSIIEAARVASSGGRWVRGSSDQKGSSGQLRSTFLFSSVLIPGILKSQDLQRIITLTLQPFAEGAKPPAMRADKWRERGAIIKRQLIDRWPTWTQRLELWREAFAEQGIAGRNADNWATTLAMAQMMTAEAMPMPDELQGWTEKIARYIKTDLAELGTDADEVLVHLMSQPFDVFRRGEQFTVAQWVQVAAQSPGAPEALLNEFSADRDGKERRAQAANAKLAKALIKVVSERDQPGYLFVGNAKAASLLTLFEGTQWAGGAWKQSLERVKGASWSKTSRTLAGVSTRGVEIPLTSTPGLEMFPQDRNRAPKPIARSPLDIEENDF